MRKYQGFKGEIDECFPRVNDHIAIPIKIDFDGTIAYHCYECPIQYMEINGRAIEVLKKWSENYNLYIILYTTRDGKKLKEAVDFLNQHGIGVNAVNDNPLQKEWTTSNKIYGFLIDDMSTTKVFYDAKDRATVDWDWVDETFTPRLERMKKFIDEIESETKNE